LIVTKTKTDKTRFLPMNQSVRDELQALKAQAGDKSRFVFESPKKPGEPLGEIKKAFNAVLKDAGIEDFHFHDFRHTAATRLAEAGADVYLIAEILGGKFHIPDDSLLKMKFLPFMVEVQSQP